MKLVSLRAAAAAFVVVASPLAAAPVTYAFSGVLTGVSTFGPGVTSPFAVDQAVSGTLVYDASAIVSGFDLINQPDWTLSYRYTPLVAMQFSILTGSGLYSHVVPTQDLVASAWQLAAVARGTGGWNGVELRAYNYPVGWTAGPPSVPVPPSSYVGPLNPHAVFFWLASFGDTGLLPDTSGNLDLAALFAAAAFRTLDVRFSDSTKWVTGMERVDLLLSARIDRLAVVGAPPIPEPATWAMLIAGFGMVGGAMRRRRVAAA